MQCYRGDHSYHLTGSRYLLIYTLKTDKKYKTCITELKKQTFSQYFVRPKTILWYKIYQKKDNLFETTVGIVHGIAKLETAQTPFLYLKVYKTTGS